MQVTDTFSFYKDQPVEEYPSSDHLVWIWACPRPPHFLTLQGIKHWLN